MERVIQTKEARDREKPNTPAWTAADSGYQSALSAYDLIARQLLTSG
jgi:hypothetical protein